MKHFLKFMNISPTVLQKDYVADVPALRDGRYRIVYNHLMHGWDAMFFYGNQGHKVGDYFRYDTLDAAIEACETDFKRIVDELVQQQNGELDDRNAEDKRSAAKSESRGGP